MSDVLIDTFTDTNGVLLSAHTPNTGSAWSLGNGTAAGEIQSNKLVFQPGFSTFATYINAVGSASAEVDISAQIFITNSGANGLVQLLGRFQILAGNAAFYGVSFNSAGISLFVRATGTGGSDVTLGTYSFSWVTGTTHTVRMTIKNAIKKVYLNGVPVITSADNSLSGAAGNNAAIIWFTPTSSDPDFQLDLMTMGGVYDPGLTSTGSVTTTALTASNTAATGGVSPYDFQYQRAPDVSGSPGSFSNVGSAQTGITTGVAPTNLSDSGLSPATTYWYRGQITYADGTVLDTVAVSVTTSSSALAAGTTSAVATGSTTATVSNTAAVNGTSPFTFQYQRAPDVAGSPGSFANVGSAQSGITTGVAPADLNDTGLSTSTKYWYRTHVTDSAAGSANSTPVSITTSARSPGSFFVSASGNDSNSGTSSGSPWLTVAKINSNGWVPGDTVLFNGGDTFAGNILINPATLPTQSTRITLGSYGTGRATINPGTSYGVKLTDSPFTTVKDLIIAGPGVTVSGSFPTATSSTTSTISAVRVESSAASTFRAGIVVDNILATGMESGVVFINTNSSSTAGFDGAQISNCVVHSMLSAGIVIWGNAGFGATLGINKNCRIVGCNVYDIYGKTAASGGDGFPLIIFNGDDCIIERCVSHDCGIAQNPAAGNGVCGPIFAHARRCYIRFCESYNFFSPQNVDGNAFDFDADCDSCVIEYCYGHDTQGACMLLWDDDGVTHSQNCIVRYNIFVNGSSGGTNSNQGSAFATGGDVRSPIIHNNIFYGAKNSGGTTNLLVCYRGSPAAVFYNNIFSIAGATMTFGDIANVAALIGNVYDVQSSASFSLVTNSGTYTGLAGLRGAGYEVSSGINYGAEGNPVYTAAGTRPVIMPANVVGKLSAYDMSGASVAKGVGINLQYAGLPPVAFDFHGNQSVLGDNAVLSGIDSGPVHFGSVFASGGGINGSGILGML